MNTLLLKVQKREATKKKLNALREKEIVPAVIYGHKIKNTNVQVFMNDFIKVHRVAGESTLFDLVVNDEKPVKVIIKDVQRDPIKGDVVHIDFHQVSMTEKLQAQIPLRFIGIAPAIKTFGGVFVTQKEAISVKCLPQDLVTDIEVDVTSIVNLEDSIKIKNIKVPEKIEVLDDSEDIVAAVIVTKEEVVEVKPVIAEADAIQASDKKEGESADAKASGNDQKAEQKKPEGKKPEGKK
ncbi:MAG: 50S ribosomal protein L25 [Parcubacteria group bacterium GW2011_GWA2_38_13]|nr:MAG: 50S ribosomal protein L25 [Parcubacteria group bacterium GW2011_GWA2_38_13]